MGVTDNRRDIFLSQSSLRRNGETSSDDDGWEIINADSADDSLPPTPPPAVAHSQRNNVPPKKKQPPLGDRLRLKKGRRSMHRYMEEKHLFQSYLGDDFNVDDNPEGWDIGHRDSRSYFTSLLTENEMLLNEFIDNSEKVEAMIKTATRQHCKNKRLRKQSLNDDCYNFSEDENDPEEAFLSIGQNLRQAFKKHLPLGMLEALENEIVEYFRENPGTEYISSELSSYERLLVHAASSYNKLDSRSFDKNGKRILVIHNRNQKKSFCPVDPSLSKYLTIRSRKMGKI